MQNSKTKPSKLTKINSGEIKMQMLSNNKLSLVVNVETN